MSGYPQGNPQFPHIYPQIYNPSNAPPPAAMAYPAAGTQPYPGPGGQYYPTAAPGFAYQGSYSGQPGNPPPVMSYPGAQPSAPQVYGNYQNVTVGRQSTVEWVSTTPMVASSLSNRAVIGGYEGHDHSPLWVIRAIYERDLVPGKLAIKHKAAYVPWNGKECSVNNIEVCCVSNQNAVRWIESSNGNVPPGAVQAGHTVDGETLFVGRATHRGSLTPGKIHPSHKVMYMSFGGDEVPHQAYEVLCYA